MMTDYLQQALMEALRQMDDVPADFVPELETPRDTRFGDLSTNCAMKLARHLRRSPMSIAKLVATRLSLDPEHIATCEIAKPGFINFRFSNHHLYRALATCLETGKDYGRNDTGKGRTALVEFVSANPTGPLTVGHGRNAVLGDTIANFLEWCSYTVTREYYYNDAGRQMRILGASVRARYAQVLHEEGKVAHDHGYATKVVRNGADEPVRVPVSFPEDGYLGEYIVEVARSLVRKHGNALVSAEGTAPFTRAAEEAIFQDIESTLQRLGIRMDTFFNERSLYDNGTLDEVLSALDDAGHLYRKNGATWLRTSALGKEKDTVLVKRSGEPTYRLPDIAYHRDKLLRDYDVCIDVFGADHIATYPDILRALRVLGFDADKVEVILYQFVTLVRGGQEVKMSTRKANFVTLDELISEVGSDVTRFFFLMRSAGKHLEFDLDLAKEASEKNPVFYLQYAHARICSILRKAVSVGFEVDTTGNFTSLTHEAEIALIKQVVRFPQALRAAAEAREPHRLTTYLRAVAEAFSRFYHECRIIGEPLPIAGTRMALGVATRTVLSNGLSALGINAPTRMDKRETA